MSKEKQTAKVRDYSQPIKGFGESVFWRFASLWLLVSLFYFLYHTHPYYLGGEFNNARKNN